MLKIIHEYIEDGYSVKQYSVDGINVLYTDKELILESSEQEPPVLEVDEDRLTVEEMQAKILLNTEMLLIQKEIGV